MKDIKYMENQYRPGLLTRIRSWLLGVDPEIFDGVRTMLNGYRGSQYKGNSVIMGGPTSWTWNATIDDAHHGVRTTSGQHPDVVGGSAGELTDTQHGDRTTNGQHPDVVGGSAGELTDAQHGTRGSGLHADSHNRAHDMDSGSDHNAGTQGDIVRAGSGGAWETLGIGSEGQLLTVDSGVPAWADAPDVAEHGNEKHNPDFYALNGSNVLTAPLNMELTDPLDEPDAVAGNEGKLYYLTPGASAEGIIKMVMKNSTAAFELVQLAVST